MFKPILLLLVQPGPSTITLSRTKVDVIRFQVGFCSAQTDMIWSRSFKTTTFLTKSAGSSGRTRSARRSCSSSHSNRAPESRISGTTRAPSISSESGRSGWSKRTGRSRSSCEAYTEATTEQKQLILLYTVNHKKRDILFVTITSANLNRFLQFLYRFNPEEILHATAVEFTTSP